MRRALWLAVLGSAPALAVAQEGGAVDAPNGHLEQLIEVLAKDDSYKVRLQAAVLLGRASDARAVEPLIKTLTADEHYTVRAAATALANLEEPRAIAHIVRAAAQDPDAFVREEAGRALRKYDREEALPYIRKTYGSEDPRVRRAVVTYLAEAPFEADEPVFVRALGDVPDIFALTKAAVLALPAEQKLRFLATAVEHTEPAVRRGAVMVLHAMGTKEATDLVLKVYERDIEVDQVRTATREALRDLRQFLPVQEFVTAALAEADKYERGRAIKRLGVVGGPEALKALLGVLAEDEMYVRGTAVMALRDLGDPSAVEALEKLLQDAANQRIAPQIRTAVKQLKKQSTPPAN